MFECKDGIPRNTIELVDITADIDRRHSVWPAKLMLRFNAPQWRLTLSRHNKQAAYVNYRGTLRLVTEIAAAVLPNIPAPVDASEVPDIGIAPDQTSGGRGGSPVASAMSVDGQPTDDDDAIDEDQFIIIRNTCIPCDETLKHARLHEQPPWAR